SVIEAALLPALVGWGRAREILYLGENFSARDAASWGLLEQVVPEAELDSAVERCIASILSNGPAAMRLQKKLIRSWEDLPLSQAIEAGVESFREAWASEEPRRMMAEYLARRKK